MNNNDWIVTLLIAITAILLILMINIFLLHDDLHDLMEIIKK
jgi:hypothetical protein